MKILLDPGHGGADPGAQAGGVREADINLAVAKRLGALLAGEGVAVHFSRQGDRTVSLGQRCGIERRIKPGLTISLHCNSFSSPGPDGLEVFTSPGRTASDAAAESIAKSLELAFPDSRFRYDFADGDRDKEAKYRILVGTVGPAVLVEMGFMSNPVELDWLCDPHTQERMASAICSGVLDWARKKPQHELEERSHG